MGGLLLFLWATVWLPPLFPVGPLLLNTRDTRDNSLERLEERSTSSFTLSYRKSRIVWSGGNRMHQGRVFGEVSSLCDEVQSTFKSRTYHYVGHIFNLTSATALPLSPDFVKPLRRLNCAFMNSIDRCLISRFT